MSARLQHAPIPALKAFRGLELPKGFRFNENLHPSEARAWDEPLWPTPYADDTPESAWRFILEQRSYIETTGEVLPMPADDYLEAYCYLWHEAKQRGETLGTEKCRRLIISWEARSLELHQMGLGRCDQILVGEDFEMAAKHVWRLQHLYTDLRARKTGWHLPPHDHQLFRGEKQLKQFSLPNGSMCNYANGQASGLQGDGVRIITMEEAGLYRYLKDMLGQAQILTVGPTSSRAGTLVNLITNTPPVDSPGAHAWQEFKKGWKDVAPRA